MSILPEATAFRCDADALWVDFADGRSLAVPLAWFPRLLAATPAERAAGRIGHGGTGLHWDALDEDISVSGLLAGRGAGHAARFNSEHRPAPRQVAPHLPDYDLPTREVRVVEEVDLGRPGPDKRPTVRRAHSRRPENEKNTTGE